MKITYLPIADLKPFLLNAREHPQEQIDLLAQNIQRFGFTVPVLIDKENNVIAGHGRIKAMQSIGEKEVPCLRMEKLTDAEVNALRIADNRLAELSKWNMKALIPALKELSPDLFLLTGFEKDLIIDPDDKDDDVPEAPPARSKLGDVWEIGNHKIMCGDSTDMAQVAKLMGEHKADMVFTDPPYNIDYSGRGENTSNGIEGDNQTPEEFDKMLNGVFHCYRQIIKEGGGMYVFHASRTQIAFEEALKTNGFEIKNQLIWNKPVAAMGWGDYRWKHEPFFYCGVKGYSIQFYAGRDKTTIWDFQKSEAQLLAWAKKMKRKEAEGKTTIWTMRRDKMSDYVHPTQKPVELIRHALENSSKAGRAYSPRS
jgi:site-specific DNA-methyltransferase (adenine-specific)